MQLWSEAVETMRPAARQAVMATLGALSSGFAHSSVSTADVLEQVAGERAQLAAMFVEVPEAGDVEIAGVPCRVIRPDTPACAVYLHFHGGGMIRGAPRMSDETNRDLCRRFDMAVVSVDYRLAPEHPYPAASDDGLAVIGWLLEHGAAQFGSSRIVVGGESSGAYMAAEVLLRLRDDTAAIDRVLGANLMYGIFDWGRSPSQRGVRTTDGPDMLDPARLQFFADCYLPGLTDEARHDAEYSPAFADLCRLPPALFSVGSADHLLDDTLMMAIRWSAAGNDTELFVAPDMPHGFNVFPCAITEAWEQQRTAWFRRILGNPAPSSA